MGPTQTPLTALESALAGVLAAERARQHLTLDAIVKRAKTGISRVAYNRLEKGQRHADMEQLEACARALGMSLTDLLLLAVAELEKASAKVVTEEGEPTGETVQRRGSEPPHPREPRQSARHG